MGPLTLFAGREETGQGRVEAPGRGAPGPAPLWLHQRQAALGERSDGRAEARFWNHHTGRRKERGEKASVSER